MGLQFHPELHVSGLCQLMDLLISQPELLIVVTKPKLVISPVPVKVLPRFSKITTPLNDLLNENYLEEKNTTSCTNLPR